MKTRYKHQLLLIGIFCAIISSSNFSQLNTLGSSEQITIRVGSYENPPKVYTNIDGNAAGFYPTIINYIAQKEGWKIEYINGTWDEGLERLENGQIDMMQDIAWSQARSAVFEFNSVTVIENWGTIYEQPGINVTSWEDLENKIIAVPKGDIHTVGEQGIINQTSQKGINCTFFEVNSYEEAFLAIHNKSAQLGVVNRYFGLYKEENYNVKSTPLFYNPVNLKFAFPKNAALNEILISKIDQNLIALKEDRESIYYDALDKYILETQVTETIPEWLIWIFWISIGFVMVFFLTSVILKKRIEQKIRENVGVNRSLEKANEVLFDTICLMQTIPTGVLAVDFKGNITITNNVMKEIFRITYNNNIDIGDNINALASNELIENLLQICNKEQIRYQIAVKEHNIITNHVDHKIISLKTNHHYDVFYSIMFKMAKEHVPTGVLFVLNEVTPFIELEQMRKQFISTVSHELRTPIASINLTLENLTQYKDRIKPEQKDYMLGLMVKSGKVLAEMIEDLLISSRIENSKLTIIPQPTDVVELFNEVLYQLTGKIEDKKVTIIKNFPDKLMINCDPKRFAQILRVLIDNAVKYSPTGSEIDLELITHGNRTIKGKLYDGIIFRIEDHGMGIPAKDQTNLFTRFFRASNVGTIVGTGLGLAIAKELTELHKGFIDIESKEGVGTIFYLIFPDSIQVKP